MVYNTARRPEALRSVPGARAVCGSMPSGLGRRHPHGSLTAYRNHARWAHETDSWRRCTLRVPAMPGVAYRRTSARPAWPRSRLVHAAGSADPHATTGGRACGVQGPRICNLRCVCAGVAWPCALATARLVSAFGWRPGRRVRPACVRAVRGRGVAACQAACLCRAACAARRAAPAPRRSPLRPFSAGRSYPCALWLFAYILAFWCIQYCVVY
jgi:hypothetical protein